MTSNHNLIYLWDPYINGFLPIVLDIIYFMSIVFAISVIIIKNPISSILCLIALFITIACYLCILGMTFIGLSYLLVYVGAISILFLFILMLINIRVSELTVNTTNSIPLVLIISVFFIFIVNKVLPYDSVSVMTYIYKDVTPSLDYAMHKFDKSEIRVKELYISSSNSWDSNIAETPQITTIGNVMYTTYFIWLILTSILLLLAMVGCIVITIKG